MHIGQTCRFYRNLSPQTVNGASAAVSELIDLSGASEVLVVFTAGTIGAADSSALNLQTTDDGIQFSLVTGSAMTPPVSTSDNKTWVWRLDLKNINGLKRYISILFTMGAANATIQGFAVVFYPNIGPINATQANVTGELITL